MDETGKAERSETTAGNGGAILVIGLLAAAVGCLLLAKTRYMGSGIYEHPMLFWWPVVGQIICGILAVGAGMALVTGLARREERAAAGRWLLPWLSAICGVSLLSIAPYIHRARERARWVSDAANLKCIGLCLNMYALENDWRYPPDLGVLANEGYITGDGRIWTSPGSGTRPPESAAELAAGRTDFLYLAAGLRRPWAHQHSGRTVLMHTRVAALGDRVCVLFVDGHVERWRTTDVRKEGEKRGYVFADDLAAEPPLPSPSGQSP